MVRPPDCSHCPWRCWAPPSWSLSPFGHFRWRDGWGHMKSETQNLLLSFLGTVKIYYGLWIVHFRFARMPVIKLFQRKTSYGKEERSMTFRLDSLKTSRTVHSQSHSCTYVQKAKPSEVKIFYEIVERLFLEVALRLLTLKHTVLGIKRWFAAARVGQGASVSCLHVWKWLLSILGWPSGWQRQDSAVLFSINVSCQSLLLITLELCQIAVIMYFGAVKCVTAVNCSGANITPV